MPGRAPGRATARSIHKFLRRPSGWQDLPFNERSGGSGASMRATPIGLRWPHQSDRLVSAAIESSRMTHNNDTAMFGALGAALFCSFALNDDIPMIEWPLRLLKCIEEEAIPYLVQCNRSWHAGGSGIPTSLAFAESLKQYIALRGIDSGRAVYPEPFGVVERDVYYKSISFSGCGGASGHDSIIIAFDALLGCNGDWIEFLSRGALHGGDSDTTATIGGAWFGAKWGLQGVPASHLQGLEFGDRLAQIGRQLYRLAT